MKKLSFLLLICAMMCSAAFASDEITFDAPVRAEVISQKAFAREDHDDGAARVATYEEGDPLQIIGEWKNDDGHLWFAISVDGKKCWIYGRNIQRLDVPASASASSSAEQTQAELPQPGMISANETHVAVIARGEGTNRQEALEQAWIDAVRMAVGAVISSKSEINDDKFAEQTILHSRGAIESFDVIGSDESGGRSTVTIKALVKREILVEESKKYLEAKTVKTSGAANVVKAQMDENAGAVTKSDKIASGLELLKELFAAYPLEAFWSAQLVPDIKMTKDKKPYIQIIEKFDQDRFWKEFIPKLHEILGGIADKKKDMQYSDNVRKANTQLRKTGYADNAGVFRNEDDMRKGIGPFCYDYHKSRSYKTDSRDYMIWKVCVPKNDTTYTLYDMPCYYSDSSYYVNKDDYGVVFTFYSYVYSHVKEVTFLLSYLDGNGEVIASQPIYRGTTTSIFPHSFEQWQSLRIIRDVGIITPGFAYTRSDGQRNTPLLLGTANYNKDHNIGWLIELDTEELAKLDSIKFEIILEDVEIPDYITKFENLRKND